MTEVRVEHLIAGYGDVQVLRDLDLVVPSGSLMAVLGASGSGKTTLLRALAGFIRPRSGTIHFGDRIVAGPNVWVPPEKRGIGIVPQEGALFPHLDVAANVGFGLAKGQSARVEKALELVGMRDAIHARPHELSGGQQQRIAIARALAPEPTVLLLDEPFTALDAGLRLRLRQEVKDLLTSLGTTSIMVTHDQEEALSIAQQVAVMRAGRIVQVGAPADIYENPADLQIARFVGDVVELPATQTRSGVVESAIGEVSVEGDEQPGDGVLILRPEQLVIVDERPVGGDHPGGASGQVQSASYHGHDSLFTVKLDQGGEISVRVPGGGHVHPGDRVRVLVTGAGRLYRDVPADK
jgi:iron(III) transport system ATP-binding protein